MKKLIATLLLLIITGFMIQPTERTDAATNTAEPTIPAAPIAAAPAVRTAPRLERPVKARPAAVPAPKRADRLRAAFSNREAGRAWGEAAVGVSAGLSGDPSEATLSAIGWLRTHPAEAFAELEERLPGLAEEFPVEHQFLLQFAGQLSIGHEAAIRLWSDALLQPVQLDAEGHPGQAFFGPAIALEMLIRNVEDRDAVGRLLGDALASQASPEARAMLLARFRNFDPDRAEALAARYLPAAG